MACGRKHYILVTKDNNIMVWGNVFKDKSDEHSEGFSFHYGDSIFDDGKVNALEAKYGIFGALVEN